MEISGTAVAQAADMAGSVLGSSSGKASDAETARRFEGMLWQQVFQVMRKTVHTSGLFGDSGQARNTCEYLLDQAVVESAMRSGKGLGLAERLEEELGRHRASLSTDGTS